jgi:tRNA-splicing ligase RtcB (3'-phosphate/5'-hydroxy nucleic acid ligase)
MFEVEKLEKNKVPILSWCNDPEEGALLQAKDLANHPVINHPVALMPDTHQGYGMPIGGVIAVTNAVLPNAVGLDCGCGMATDKTNAKAVNVSKEQLGQILKLLGKRVPVGMSHHNSKSKEYKLYKKWIESWVEKKIYFNTGLSSGLIPFSRLKKMLEVDTKEDLVHYLTMNLGTLGGGNHYCEIQKDEDDNIWLMLHSGSRNLGYRVADYHNKIAIKLNETFHSPIPNKDLAFLPADMQEGKDYLDDMHLSLEFALENRKRMMDAFKESMIEVLGDVEFLDEINIHHNYASLENVYGKNLWIHRKGATSARKGQMGIIPGSMGTSSYIVEGLGNQRSYNSCSHGAGRKMSRTKASATLTKEECNASMEDVVFGGWGKVGRGKLKGSADLSESPLAYKDIDEVMKSQEDLVEIKVKLTPIANMKG